MNYLKRKLSLLFIVLSLLFVAAQANAQARTLTGSVIDASNKETLFGATIQVKGVSNKGTLADLDGNFSIGLSAGEDSIMVSYIGYITKTISVKNKTSIVVSLSSNTELIEELVVIGYGTQKKSDLTGAISVVDSKDLARANASSFDKALQGKASGVMVTSNSGQPGEGSSIRIRGVGSISKSSDPLFVIDGLITDKNALNSINPSDIESLQVLKDASAASIYGAQGANGVILVTTKKGERGKTKVNFSHYTGISKVPGYYDIMNGAEYATTMSQAWANKAIQEGKPEDPVKLVYDNYLANPYASVNMPRLMTQDGFKHDYTLSANGGGEFNRFAFSTNLYDETGTMINTNFKRYSIRLNSEFDVNKRWKIGETFAFTRTQNQGTSHRGGNLWNTAIVTSPLMHLYNADNLGGFGGPDQAVTGQNDKSNPYAEQMLNNNSSSNNRVNGSVYSQFEFFKGFTYKASLGFEYSNGYTNQWSPAYYLGPYGNRNNATSVLTERSDISQSLLVNNVLNYTTTIASDHNINVMIGQEALKAAWNYVSATGADYINDNVNVLSQAQVISAIGGGITEHRTLSYFGRFMYDYKSKILFTSSLRRDGSSRFGADNRFGYFPSAALAYKVNEDFFTDVKELNLMKVRVGWGQTGNENIGDYNFIDYVQGPLESRYVLGTDQHTVYGGAIIRSGANKSIAWEAAEMTNVGLDLNLFNNSVQFTAEYYYKKQDKMLVKFPLPRIFGRQNPDADPWVNIGQISNAGFEFNLIYKNTIGDLFYSVSGNLTTIDNKVVSLPNHVPIYGGSTITQEGHSIGSFYGYIADGIYQTQEEIDNAPSQENRQPGDIRFKDLNSDGYINALDRTIIGKAIPDIVYGFNVELNYKDFDFSMNFQGVQGVNILNNVRSQIGLGTDPSDRDNNRLRTVLDYWTPGSGINDQTRLSVTDAANNARTSTFFIEDGSYFRLKNIQFGYNIPNAVTKLAGLSKMRIYVSATNLLTLTKYSGLDPEISSWDPLSSNIDGGSYPVPKSFMGGVVVDF